jgi:hypothetical protein
MGHSIYRGESRSDVAAFPDETWRWDRLEPGLFETIVPWVVERVTPHE